MDHRPLVLIVESVRVRKLVNSESVNAAGGSPTFVPVDNAVELLRENEELLRGIAVVGEANLVREIRAIKPTVFIIGISNGEEQDGLELVAAGANTTMVKVVDVEMMTEILQNLPAPV